MFENKTIPGFVDNFVKKTMKVEGGYVNHPSDRGGPTKFGITEATAKRYGYLGKIENIPEQVAYSIYVERYFYNPGFDLVADVSQIVAHELFDSGVNFGPGVPVIWFQRWLNGFNRQGKDYSDILVDGIIGSGTIDAFKSYLKKRPQYGEGVMCKALNCSQGARYLELAEGRQPNEDFLFGWVLQRVYM